MILVGARIVALARLYNAVPKNIDVQRLEDRPVIVLRHDQGVVVHREATISMLEACGCIYRTVRLEIEVLASPKGSSNKSRLLLLNIGLIYDPAVVLETRSITDLRLILRLERD